MAFGDALQVVFFGIRPAISPSASIKTFAVDSSCFRQETDAQWTATWLLLSLLWRCIHFSALIWQKDGLMQHLWRRLLNIWSFIIRIGNWKVKPIIRQIMDIELIKKPYISCNYNKYNSINWQFLCPATYTLRRSQSCRLNWFSRWHHFQYTMYQSSCCSKYILSVNVYHHPDLYLIVA